jgi:SAM-dependent methyltransferase
VKLSAASCGASVTEQSGTAPERDTRLRQGFGAVTSRFLPAASCGASARRRVKMAKQDEISYVETVSRVDNVSVSEFTSYLSRKPYSDISAGDYLMDISQLLKLLPTKPARILDLGVGSGWTSEIFARVGYEVIGLDISPEMIEIARSRISEGLALGFHVQDYEKPISFGLFDAVVMYDSLHHCENENQVMENISKALKAGGVFLAVEPGKGHSRSKAATDATRKYGTTERDMPFSYVKRLLVKQGFREVKQYMCLKQLSLFDLSNPAGRFRQVRHFIWLAFKMARLGATSIIVAQK